MAKLKSPKTKVTFTCNAPGAKSVLLAGDFTGWQEAPLALKKDRAGLWKKTVTLPEGQYEYRLLVDGQWQDDPNCQNRHANQYGGENCVCEVRAATPAEPAAAKPATAA